MRYVSNVQVCAVVFVVSYLVRCVAGKETRKIITFLSGALNREVIGNKGTSASYNKNKWNEKI